jgi:transcriptional regulator with XRE-family HTH domain
MPDPMEKPELFYALVARRQAKGLPALPEQPADRVAELRHLEMLRLRLIQGLSLHEVGERTGVSSERVRQLLVVYFDVRGTPPAARAKAQVAALEQVAASVGFGLRLRELRAERRVSQERLARRTGINRVTIGKLEQGASDPRLSTILRLADGLDMPPEALVRGLSENWGET